MTTRTALARARRGAAWLDARIPRWRNEVDPDRLNMGEGFGPCGCVLAQIGGDYDDVAADLGLDPQGTEVVQLGFYLDDYEMDEYDMLTKAWRKVLRSA